MLYCMQNGTRLPSSKNTFANHTGRRGATTALTPETLPALQAVLTESDLDGWLLFDFQQCNPIALGVLDLQGMLTRRHLAFVPRVGVPVAITPTIEPGPWERWPSNWDRKRYTSWQDLVSIVAERVRGKRVAMEYSPGGAIPYSRRVPLGVIEMVRASGATLLPSGDLVTRFFARWTEHQLARHREAAELLADIARSAFAWVRDCRANAQRVTESEIRTLHRAHCTSRITKRLPADRGGGRAHGRRPLRTIGEAPPPRLRR